MFALVANIFGEKNLVKISADLHPRQGNLLQGTSSQDSTKPLFTTQYKQKNSPYFPTCFF
jgi:hypothetical protein